MKKIILLFFPIINIFLTIYPATIGSDTEVSKEDYTQLTDNENRIATFAFMEKGFTLTNNTATCTFDSIFPIGNLINIRGGYLYINKDLEILEDTEFAVTTTIIGKENNIYFPYSHTKYTLPTSGTFSLIDSAAGTAISHQVSWSHDDKYLLVCQNTTLRIYSFENNTLTQEATLTLPSTAVSFQWHPKDYHFAIIYPSTTNPLKVYLWNPSTSSITLVSEIGSSLRGRSLCWSPSGNYIAATVYNGNELQVFSFNGTTLNSVTSIDIPGGTRYSYYTRVVHWNSNENYIASGYYRFNGQPELYIHSFDGSTLTLNASAELDDYVLNIDWNYTNSLILVGTYYKNQTLQLFEHNPDAGTLTEITTAQTGETRAIKSVTWRDDGKYFAYVKWQNNNPNIKIYKYNEEFKESFNLWNYYIDVSSYDIEWSHNGQYIAYVDSTPSLKIFGLNIEPSYIKDTKLIFNSDIDVNTTFTFVGNCSITANNNKITFTDNAQFVIADNSTLKLKNLYFDNVKNGNLKNQSDTSKILFDNVIFKLNEDFYFDTGSFEVINGFEICGTHTFCYQSAKTSTIREYSHLYLTNNATFKYEPNSTNQQLIILENINSKIIIENASLVTTETSLCLTKGRLFFKDNASIASQNPGEIIIGNNDTNDDLYCEIAGGSQLNLINGTMHYKNVSNFYWQMQSWTSLLNIYSYAKLKLSQNLDLKEGHLIIYKNGILEKQNYSVIGAVSFNQDEKN